jgi:hypothetical protein
MSGFEREVEARMSKKLDVFTDEFSPPGATDGFPGGDFSKRGAPYGKPHEDSTPDADPSFWDKSIRARHKLHSAGDPADQEKMDWLDEQVYKIEAPIKNPYDQFPGDVDMQDHKKIGGFDEHSTDPTKLSASMAEGSFKASNGQKFHYVQDAKTKRFEVYDDRGSIIAWSIPSLDQVKYNVESRIQRHSLSGVKKMADEKKIDGPEAFDKEVEKRMSPPSPGDLRAMVAKLIAEARRRGTSVSSLLNSSEYSSYRPYKNEIMGAVQASTDRIYGENYGKGQS